MAEGISAAEVEAMKFTFRHPNAYLHNGWSRPRGIHPMRGFAYEHTPRVCGAMARENSRGYDNLDEVIERAAEAQMRALQRKRAKEADDAVA